MAGMPDQPSSKKKTRLAIPIKVTVSTMASRRKRKRERRLGLAPGTELSQRGDRHRVDGARAAPAQAVEAAPPTAQPQRGCRHERSVGGTPENPNSPRGQGAVLGLWSDASRRDLLLFRQAIRKGWPVPPERKHPIIEELAPQIETADTRLLFALTRAFLAASGADLAQLIKESDG